MAPRCLYALIFTYDPPAADIVREDLILPGHLFAKDAECRFKWADPKKQPKPDKDKAKPKPPPVYDEVDGKIIEVGRKVNLQKLKVNEKAELVQVGGVLTRAQEKARMQTLQNNAQINQLQSVAERMLQGGPGATYDRAPIVTRVPQKRDSAMKQEIRSKLFRLPCFKPGNTKTEIVTGKMVYMDTGKFSRLKIRFDFRQILRVTKY